MGKIFKYEGEEFEVSEPKNCRIEVLGVGLTGEITIHEATGMFRESVMGWGTDQSTMDSAIRAVCRRMIQRAAKDSREALCKGMGEFYENLESNG